MKSEKRKIELELVLRRKLLSNSHFTLDSHAAEITKLHKIPWIVLFKNPAVSSSFIAQKFLSIRNYLISISKFSQFFIPGKYVVLKLSFKVQNKPKIFQFTAHSYDAREIRTYIYREAAIVGIELPELDLSHEYDFRRNANKYEAYIVSGTSILEKDSNQNSNTFADDENRHLIISGCESKSSDWKPILNHNIWKYQKISNANVIHGRVIYSSGAFFFTDTSRIPIFSQSQRWPSLIRRIEDDVVQTPNSTSNLPTLTEAVFIGGTNNFMHFVLEDIPRIILADILDIPGSVPLLIRSNLSKQIIGTITRLTKRELISVDTFQEIAIDTLHAFQFKNFLPETMSGSVSASKELIDLTLLAEARKRLGVEKISESQNRILIIREPGLFRPLTNSKMIEKILTIFFGFRAENLGSKTFEEVSSIFGTSNLVVGEYGAGLSNIIFAPGPLTILELRGPLERNALEYAALSAACGFEHKVICGRAKKLSRFGIANGPFRIPIVPLVRILR